MKGKDNDDDHVVVADAIDDGGDDDDDISIDWEEGDVNSLEHTYESGQLSQQ